MLPARALPSRLFEERTTKGGQAMPATWRRGLATKTNCLGSCTLGRKSNQVRLGGVSRGRSMSHIRCVRRVHQADVRCSGGITVVDAYLEKMTMTEQLKMIQQSCLMLGAHGYAQCTSRPGRDYCGYRWWMICIRCCVVAVAVEMVSQRGTHARVVCSTWHATGGGSNAAVHAAALHQVRRAHP